MIYLELFLSFLQIGLFSVGGGYAAIPLIQEQAVEQYGWLSMEEFADLVTIAEMTPGPVAVNAATFVGIRIAGIPGALTATFACILPSLILVSLLAFLYYRYKKMSAFQNLLSGLRPAVVALIASAGVSLLLQSVFTAGIPSVEGLQPVALVLFMGAFFLLRKFRWNAISVMLVCGGCSLLIGLLTGAVPVGAAG